jgi:hypothetical protein
LEQTFKQVGQAAAQQGGDLLTQALQADNYLRNSKRNYKYMKKMESFIMYKNCHAFRQL